MKKSQTKATTRYRSCNQAGGKRNRPGNRAGSVLAEDAGTSVDQVVSGDRRPRPEYRSKATPMAKDAFYIQRSNSNCAPDFEGGESITSNNTDQFLADGSPIVVSSPGWDAFLREVSTTCSSLCSTGYAARPGRRWVDSTSSAEAALRAEAAGLATLRTEVRSCLFTAKM